MVTWGNDVPSDSDWAWLVEAYLDDTILNDAMHGYVDEKYVKKWLFNQIKHDFLCAKCEQFEWAR